MSKPFVFVESRPDGGLYLADPVMSVWLQKRFNWV